LQERLAKLQGGVAVIKVGGASDVEVGEIKDRVDDALSATEAALKEGIVVGGGCALLYASMILDNFTHENSDIKVGVELVKRAIRVPTKTIIQNSGEEGAVVVGRLLEQKDVNAGYDASSGQYKKNMFDAGIIDPTLVVKTSLE